MVPYGSERLPTFVLGDVSLEITRGKRAVHTPRDNTDWRHIGPSWVIFTRPPLTFARRERGGRDKGSWLEVDSGHKLSHSVVSAATDNRPWTMTLWAITLSSG